MTTTFYVQQRYVTASGHDHWIFLLVDKETGGISCAYQAPDHPSANQGGATAEDIPQPFCDYDKEKYEVVVVDNDILDTAKLKVTSNRSLMQVILEDYEIDNVSKPKYKSREIIKIDQFGDMEGETIKEMKTPEWAKAMIASDKIKIKRKMVDSLPTDFKYKKMKLRSK